MTSGLTSVPFQLNPYLAILLLAWILFWKGLALWRAGRNNQQYWFVVLLLVNTFGILELIYYFAFQHIRPDISDSKLNLVLAKLKKVILKPFHTK